MRIPKSPNDPERKTIDRIMGRFEKMQGDRGLWEVNWQDCADYILPRKNNVIRTAVPGEKKGITLFDTTGCTANELLAAFLHGTLTNPATQFFDYTTGDDDTDARDDVRMWLQACTNKGHAILNGSNLQTEIHELYLDLGWCGTSPLQMEEHPDRVINFSARFIAECYVDENDLGSIDTVYRKFQWSARNIVQFLNGKVPQEVMDEYEKDPSHKFTIIHAVETRDPGEKVAKAGPLSFPVASHMFLFDEETMLNTSGFRELPYAVPRWTKATGEKYGRSPGMTALPDLKMVNEMEKTVIRGAQKTVDPPLVVADDGVVLPLNGNPSGLNYARPSLMANGEPPIRPILNNARIDFGFQTTEAVRQRIRQAFFIDQLQLAQGPQMTATETSQRVEDRLKFMGPMMGRLGQELLSPMGVRLFKIMARRGLIPPPPQGVKNIDVKFSSLVARAQKASEGQNIMRVFQTVAGMAGFDPQVADNFDIDASARRVAKVYGMPQDLLRDKKSVKGIRDQRAAALNQNKQAEDNAKGADMVSKVLPAMAQAKQAGVA